MFDFRYHAVSLVAVFIALAVGLLLGVAIGDSGLVSTAEKGLRNSLRGEVRNVQRRADTLQTQLDAALSVQTGQLYPVAVTGRLTGKRIGVLVLGTPSDTTRETIRDDVKHALRGSGGRLVSVPVVREPLDVQGLAATAGHNRYAGLAKDPALVEPLGRRIGVQLARGGSLIGRLRRTLLTSASTGPLDGLEGVVVYKPAQKLTGVAAQTVNDFDDGVLAGLASEGVPVVGVEELTTSPSQVPWYGRHDIASVDDVDQVVGRLATVLVLAGAGGREPEPYGHKSTAQQATPLTQ